MHCLDHLIKRKPVKNVNARRAGTNTMSRMMFSLLEDLRDALEGVAAQGSTVLERVAMPLQGAGQSELGRGGAGRTPVHGLFVGRPRCARSHGAYPWWPG